MYTPKSFVPDRQQAQPLQTTTSSFTPKSFVPDKKTAGGFIGNVIKSGGKLIGDTATGIANVFNPNMEKNTIANIDRLAQGAMQKLDPTEGNKIANTFNKVNKASMAMFAAPVLLTKQGRSFFNPTNQSYEPVVNAVGDFYKQRYGDVQNVANTAYNDPVGMAADAAMLAMGIGGALKGGAALAGNSELARAGETASRIGMAADPIMATTKAAGSAGSKLFSRIKPALSNRAESMVTAGIGNPVAQAKAAEKANRSVSSFIKEYNLFDRSPETAKQIVKAIGEKFDAAAMQSGKKMSTGQIVKAFDDKIAELSRGTGGVIADNTKQMIAELERRKQMFLDSVVKKEQQLFSRPTSQADPISSLQAEAKKYKSAEEFVQKVMNESNIGQQGKLQEIPINKISGTDYPELDSALKSGKKLSIDEVTNIIKPTDDYKVGQQVKYPIEVRANNDGTYSLSAGNHRLAQKLINGESSVFASVQNVPGASTKSQLTDIYNQATTPKTQSITSLSSPLDVGLDTVTDFRRRVIDPDVPKTEFGLSPKETGTAGGVKGSRDILRSESIKVAPELEKLGLDYGMAKELEKILKSSEARKYNRQLFNFTKLGGAGVGGLISGAPGVIAGFTLEQIVNSPWFIANASDGLKAALNAKLRLPKGVTDTVSGGYNLFGRGERMINVNRI